MRLAEALLMSTHNECFYGELEKINDYHQITLTIPLIYPCLAHFFIFANFKQLCILPLFCSNHISSRQHLNLLYLFFNENKTWDMSCELSNMKYQALCSLKNKTNI